MHAPEVHYARSGEVSIAYQVIGDGPMDLVFVRALTGDLLSTWDQPLLVRHVMGLAENGRLLMLDKRGTGLSDRVGAAGGLPTLETRMDDVRAVMDAVGSERAVLWSGGEGGRITTLFAATYPERTLGVVMLNPSAKGRRAADYPWAPSDDEWRRILREVRDRWGERDYFHELISAQAPGMVDDEGFRDWFVTHMRRSLTPGAAMAFHRMAMEADVADVLPAVRVPTLVLYSPDRRGPAEYAARHIPDAQLQELPTMRGEFTWTDDETHQACMAAVSGFIRRLHPHPEPDRILTTMLFTDIVGSTELASRLGDRGWAELVAAHHARTRAELARYRGREIDVAGDGFLATFDGPARAARCALAVVEAVRDLGIEIRAGVHTGEVEVDGEAIRGIAVNLGARVAAVAEPSTVLATGTVRDLTAGSGLVFEDAGEHELRGLPDRWKLYRVVG